MDYEQARDTLRTHKPRPWCWWLLGRLAYCVACNGHWRCESVRVAWAYIDKIDEPGATFEALAMTAVGVTPSCRWCAAPLARDRDGGWVHAGSGYSCRDQAGGWAPTSAQPRA